MISWGSLLKAGLTLADIAGDVYSSVKKNKMTISKGDTSLEQLHLYLKNLEANEIKQSELILQMAEQIKRLTIKSRNAFILSVISSLVAVGVLLYVVIK